MGDIVNLRTVRKRTVRERKEAQAAENRLVHGRSKADRQLEAARNDKATKNLDQHRLDSGDER